MLMNAYARTGDRAAHPDRVADTNDSVAPV